MSELVGLIPAAGRGTRAYPYTRRIPKGMLRVAGRPIMDHLISLQRDQLGIRRIYIVISDAGAMIRDHFGDGSRWGVKIEYLLNDKVDLGLAYSVSLAAPAIREPFIMMLSDEYYQDTSHSGLAHIALNGELGYCALMQTSQQDLITKNYSVRLDDGRIMQLQEKPSAPQNELLGTGTFLLSPQIFDVLNQALAHKGAAADFIGELDAAVHAGRTMRPFYLEGKYVNINDVDSLNWANFLRRSKLLPRASLSVIIQSMGTEAGLQRMAKEFAAFDQVGEILIVAPAGTGEPDWLEEIDKAAWLEAPSGISEYGGMLAYGLDQAIGDILILVEAHYSFYPDDMTKLWAYLADADLILGTRTTRQLIQQGSSMRGIVRVSHVFLGKLIEILWCRHRIRLTDVGCTYRAIWRHSYVDIRSRLKSEGPEYILEMDIETLRSRKRLIEVPVSFLSTNEALAERYQNPAIFFRMLRTILRKRIGFD